MEREYRRVVSGVVSKAHSLWGLTDETSISLDQGEALRVMPRNDGASIIRFYLYDTLDDPARGEDLDVIDVAVLNRQTPDRVCVAPLRSLSAEFATRRLNMMFRTLGYLSALNHSSAA